MTLRGGVRRRRRVPAAGGRGPGSGGLGEDVLRLVEVVRVVRPDVAAVTAGLPDEVTIALASVAATMREGLMAFSTAAGLAVFQTLLQAELAAKIGPKHDAQAVGGRRDARSPTIVPPDQGPRRPPRPHQNNTHTYQSRNCHCHTPAIRSPSSLNHPGSPPNFNREQGNLPPAGGPSQNCARTRVVFV